MSVGGEDRPEWIRRDHWETLANEAGVAPRAVFHVMKRLVDSFPSALQKTEISLKNEPGDFSIVTDIKSHINKSLRRLQQTLHA
jgi:hypothetical protein